MIIKVVEFYALYVEGTGREEKEHYVLSLKFTGFHAF